MISERGEKAREFIQAALTNPGGPHIVVPIEVGVDLLVALDDVTAMLHRERGRNKSTFTRMERAAKALMEQRDAERREKDALRQYLQAIIAKQEEELHQEHLEQLALIGERDEALALAAVLREALETAEWTGCNGLECTCPVCDLPEGKAHAEDCILGRALALTPAAAYAELQALREVAAAARRVDILYENPSQELRDALARFATAEGGGDE